MDEHSEKGQADVVAHLSRSSSYPDAATVEVIETHISWVFLTGRYAYKLKKSVRLEFLDFSTPALRQYACLRELSLNQRFARGVYLDVLPITREPSGSIALVGCGLEIDWVVKMRRLPAEDALNVVLRQRRLTPADADDIATNLAHFYSKLDAAPIAAHEYGQLLERHVRANIATLLDALPDDSINVHRIQSAQLRFLKVEAELLTNRAAAGRVVDGHGDLRPEHIYLDSPLSIIDCVEFSDELRTVDIADELSFLAMECQRSGDPGFGKLVLDTYEQTSGDRIPVRLLAFYRSYRACVRAKVAVLRGRQQTANEQQMSKDLARQYIDWADRYAADLGPPTLLMVGGLMGSGKSTLASALASALDANLLATDGVRRNLLGASRRPARYGEDHYRPEMRNQVYEELLSEASDLLSERQSVVLDGTFLTKMLREQTYALCRRHSAKCLHIQTTCPKSTAFARIQQRAKIAESESEARAELYDQQAEELEPLSSGEPAVTVETTQPMSHQLHTAFRKLRGLLFQQA
jgi:aminoglycoside phosphotransferase family enzyme/predicted kinase